MNKRNKLRGIYLEAEEALVTLTLILLTGFALGIAVSGLFLR